MHDDGKQKVPSSIVAQLTIIRAYGV